MISCLSSVLHPTYNLSERNIMKYKLAIFDLDGTILDTLDDLTDSLNHVLAEHCYCLHTKEEVRGFVGNGIHKLIERAVPAGTSPNDIENVYNEFSAYYKIHCTDKTKPYEGIEDMLTKIRGAGYKTAVVSNKADFAVQALCNVYFEGLFDLVRGEQKGTPKKPSPEAVNAIMEKLNMPQAETVYIGDSEVDILTAANAGVDCLSVVWGFKDREFLIKNGASIIVDDASELADILLL